MLQTADDVTSFRFVCDGVLPVEKGRTIDKYQFY